MKFHEEIDQFIGQFKGQIIGQHFQYYKTTNYGEHFTFCNPKMTSDTFACLFYANRRNETRKFQYIIKHVRNTKLNE